MEALSKDLWVFIETDEEGKARNVGLELLNPGRRTGRCPGRCSCGSCDRVIRQRQL